MKAAARVIGYTCILIVFLLSFAVLAYDLMITWRARNLIRVLKTIQVGRTTGSEAVGIAERFGGSAIVIEETVTKTTDAWGWHDVPMSTCVAGACELTIRECEGLNYCRPMLGFLFRHPRFLRRVPMSGFVIDMEIKRGVVQDLQASIESMDTEIEQVARTNVYSDESHAGIWNSTPWRIHKLRAHITGGPPGRTNEIRVEAWSSAPRDRLLRAFDFNTHCLWLGVRCLPCQILPSACDAYDHGDWYEFEMPAAALAKFRQAVNGIAIGTDLQAVRRQLEDDNGFGREEKLRDGVRDKLPFAFPIGAIAQTKSSCNIDFHVKKWRLDRGSPRAPGDQYVTFVMDDDCRLKRIESHVEGIPSRP